MTTRTDLVGAFRAGWWIVPLVLAGSLGSVAYLTAGEEPPSYGTAATFAVVPHPSLDNENQVLRGLEVLERRTMLLTLSRVAASEGVFGKAAARMGTPLEELRSYRVEGSVLPSTHLIRVSVQGPDPEVVERLTGEIAAVAVVEASTHYPVFALRLLDPVEAPGVPLKGRERRTYAVAGVLGLFVGMGAAYGVGVLRHA